MRTFPADLLSPGLDAEAATKRYREGSWWSGDEPSPWFNSRWYALHNNDWLHFRSPFDHFLARGLAEDRAPSPMIDMVRFRTAHPAGTSRERYAHLVAHGAQPGAGVYSGPSDLRDAQRALLDSIEPRVLRCKPAARDHLVIMQHGHADHLEEWLAGDDRSFDVLLNHYDGRTEPIGIGDIETAQIGTKFSGVHKLSGTLIELLCSYRYLWLIDDDIVIDRVGIEECLRWCEQLDVALAQPTLTADSSTSWPDLRLAPGDAAPNKPVPISAAEIMMPIMRVDFWLRAVRYFPWSISGYGLDLLWAKMLADDSSAAWRLPVLASHSRPIDVEDGAYYRFLRSHDINPDAEWWRLVEMFGLDNELASRPAA